jgi:hypothetical protein
MDDINKLYGQNLQLTIKNAGGINDYYWTVCMKDNTALTEILSLPQINLIPISILRCR